MSDRDKIAGWTLRQDENGDWEAVLDSDDDVTVWYWEEDGGSGISVWDDEAYCPSGSYEISWDVIDELRRRSRS